MCSEENLCLLALVPKRAIIMVSMIFSLDRSTLTNNIHNGFSSLGLLSGAPDPCWLFLSSIDVDTIT